MTPRNTAIQGLRAACVLAVFAYHVIHAKLWDGAPPLADGLRYGVEVFFMISGYVIVLSLRRHASVGAFLRDRALRIFPLWLPLALAMLAAGYVGFLHGGKLPPALAEPWTLPLSLLIAAPVLPVPGIHPAQWSLSYELCFYGIAALAWRLGASSAWRIAAWGLPALLFVGLFPRALFFVPGALVALAEPWLRLHAKALRWGVLGLLVAWPAWLATGVDAAGWDRSLLGFARDGDLPLVLVAFAGALAFFASIVVAPPGQGWLERPALQWLGKVSYSFYLVHPIVLAGVKHGLLPALQLEGGPAALVLATVGLPLACLASWATWALLEVRLRRWLAHRSTAPALHLDPLGSKQ